MKVLIIIGIILLALIGAFTQIGATKMHRDERQIYENESEKQEKEKHERSNKS